LYMLLIQKKQVIGEFQIEDVLHDCIDELWIKLKMKQNNGKKFQEYFSMKFKGYAIKITKAKSIIT